MADKVAPAVVTIWDIQNVIRQHSVTVPVSIVYCKQTPNEGLNQIILKLFWLNVADKVAPAIATIWNVWDIILPALSDLSSQYTFCHCASVK